MNAIARRPRIRTVLILVNSFLVAAPLLGITAFRFYETELIRRTESNLLSQAVMIREFFLARFEEAVPPKSKIGVRIKRREIREFWSIDPGEVQPILPKFERKVYQPSEPVDDTQLEDGTPDRTIAAIGSGMANAMKRAQSNLLSGCRILDYNGVVVATTGGELGKTLKNREEVARALEGEVATIMRWRDKYEIPYYAVVSSGTSAIVFVAVPVIANDRVIGVVSLSRTPLNLAKAIVRFKELILWYFISIAGVIVMTALLTAKTITQPIYRLIHQTKLVTSGKLAASAPLMKPGSHEVAILSQSVSEMAEALQARGQYIRDFARSVSHELKTPIAAIRGSVELLEGYLSELKPDEQRKFLRFIHKDTERMERLVERLLALARAEMQNPSDAECDLATTVEATVAEFKEQGMQIVFDKSSWPEGSRAKISADALRTCVANLLENARTHAGEKVRVDVTLYCEKQKRRREAVIRVADNGPGIPPADREEVFEPFFTTARETGGTGLGLSIVRALLSSHGGQIRLLPTTSGSRFELRISLF